MIPVHLNPVREGRTPLSAERANTINDLLGRRLTGPDVMETSFGFHIKRPPPSQVQTQKLVRVTAVEEASLTVQEVRLVQDGSAGVLTHTNTGSRFTAHPWPTQQLSDYLDAAPIVMLAHLFDGFWIVQMTGDRPYVGYPETRCDPCVE